MSRIKKTFRLLPKVAEALEKKALKENRSEANVVEIILVDKLKVKL